MVSSACLTLRSAAAARVRSVHFALEIYGFIMHSGRSFKIIKDFSTVPGSVGNVFTLLHHTQMSTIKITSCISFIGACWRLVIAKGK